VNASLHARRPVPFSLFVCEARFQPVTAEYQVSPRPPQPPNAARFREIDADIPATELDTVGAVYGLLRGLVAHLDECETAWLPCIAVADQLDRHDFAVGGEKVLYLVRSNIESKVSYID
jgi:hypothetical protein